MQSQNDNREILSAQLFEMQKADAALLAAAELGATRHVIAELPDRGDILEIRGLMFEVKFTDYKRGEIRIKILENYKLTGDGTPVKVHKHKG